MTMRAAMYMEELVVKHSAIMDKYDPEKKVALIVDEWGTWFNVEPGTNPGFLYQQNTLRDALVAGLHFNIFNNHADRVRMANIAQTINVLQAIILTEGAKMILTPTYHVFDMYKVHMDAALLDFTMLSDDYEADGNVFKKVNASVSKSADGKINISLCNIDPDNGAKVHCLLDALPANASVSGTVLTSSAMNTHNTFDEPGAIKPAPFTGFTVNGDRLCIELPSKSVTLITIG
jgi:alpha-N-arabinofuranosidase